MGLVSFAGKRVVLLFDNLTYIISTINLVPQMFDFRSNWFAVLLPQPT